MRSLMDRVLENVAIVPIAGCWIWLGATDQHGYGRIFLNGRPRRLHRAVYQEVKGAAKNSVCHTCDTPCCVNPYHLYDGTHHQNMQDREQRGRANKAIGKRNGRAKYTEEQINLMRQMRGSGISLKEIAAHFGKRNTGYFSLVINKKIRSSG
ncbi:hypothetical protein [Pseudoduganella chitinolytica]|uniref:HNH nuclease domain-containing protein n=1 Tax=Pseudoduganella chitinolytica TaxID=34070 RepID=A0ABY8BHQ7_9BURK|nr:hypothetical protein [Pseudoduganella chitinolytica]WEF34898.1 hypothetical protein PX653_09100 [Pseudoduganella chitinolytica]